MSGSFSEKHLSLPYRVWAHTVYGMKMTMHIDDDLLKRVMETYDLETKTDAVHFALRELDRRARMKKFLKEGLGLTPAELKGAVYPGYDPDQPVAKVAEDERPYGSSHPD
ncbi:MAG: hypothetical protein JWO82_4171 [Akkermansiaceae bacterium]|nr:hypothetical protein [Akkermansiaceae bacterium]